MRSVPTDAETCVQTRSTEEGDLLPGLFGVELKVLERGGKINRQGGGGVVDDGEFPKCRYEKGAE